MEAQRVLHTIRAMPAHPPRQESDWVVDALEPTRCEFRIRGRLSKALLGAFPGLDAKVIGAETVLTGPLADQAAVHGVLAQIEALHLELLEFRRLSVAASAGKQRRTVSELKTRTRSDQP